MGGTLHLLLRPFYDFLNNCGRSKIIKYSFHSKLVTNLVEISKKVSCGTFACAYFWRVKSGYLYFVWRIGA